MVTRHHQVPPRAAPYSLCTYQVQVARRCARSQDLLGCARSRASAMTVRQKSAGSGDRGALWLVIAAAPPTAGVSTHSQTRPRLTARTATSTRKTGIGRSVAQARRQWLPLRGNSISTSSRPRRLGLASYRGRSLLSLWSFATHCTPSSQSAPTHGGLTVQIMPAGPLTYACATSVGGSCCNWLAARGAARPRAAKPAHWISSRGPTCSRRRAFWNVLLRCS
mmetsp:Transcript_39878/g.116376  ORF Transcript_39878/g.116376 Transcript_39878/m.116376 type:complete len:222 (-) Transcript_39878:623-1288(-)